MSIAVRKRTQRRTKGAHPQIEPCPKHALDTGSIQPCDADIWRRIREEYGGTKIFLNIPYVPHYKQRKHTLIALLCHLKLRPVLASEEKREGLARICKLCELIQTCTWCISDLTYLERHNVPMEVGLILGLGRRNILLYGGQKFETVDGVKVKAILARASNLHHAHEVVYYDGNPKSLTRELLDRWRKSPDLQKILAKSIPRKPDLLENMAKRVFELKSLVDKYSRQEHGDYSRVIERLRYSPQRTAP